MPRLPLLEERGFLFRIIPVSYLNTFILINLNLLSDSKKHYPVLDALRGVAALTVVVFHIFEAHATSHLNQLVNHGYLAVDFFFMLSGYVISYAYDDRWNDMSIAAFFKRRLIRLQPMVVFGMILGALLFYSQESVLWPGIVDVPVWKLLLVMFIGATLIPVPLSLDLRGWQEMHPLNGPGWSLFFEYIANIAYALIVRKFSNIKLSLLVLAGAVALVHLCLTAPAGDVVGGWSLTPQQLHIGFTRLTYPFFAGLLLRRICRPGHVRHGFFKSALLLLIILAMPRVGGAERLWLNGLYEAFSIIVLFPLIIHIGASACAEPPRVAAIGNFLGRISYPIYITHYPLVYTYTAWVADTRADIAHGIPWMLLVFLCSILIAWLSEKFYDVPVRSWIVKRIYL